MDTYNFKGLVFRSVDYGDTSKIVTVLTEDKGFISLMARGVKNPKSKKQNLVASFTEMYFEANRSGDFYYLKDGEIINDNLNLRQGLINIYLGQLFLDIVERTSIKDQVEKDHYSLLAKSLSALNNNSTKEDILKIANMFLIKYISMIGYKPSIFSCLKCKKRKFKQVYFSKELGGILCQNHYTENAIRLSFEEYQYLIDILLGVFEKLDIIDGGIDQVKIFNLIIDFIFYNLDIKLPASLNMFKKLIGAN
ncbi:DNA repair protein RecO [uncultured Helcococcus sp.]|uniref:DNA repair protein RecO n=1 Tax=uncultured Helcococcus sp. TaxID=1072508 RepID=UPI00288A06C3|nr:DNA repair protein RecO [uncultured Helcococcus sp.]